MPTHSIRQQLAFLILLIADWSWLGEAFSAVSTTTTSATDTTLSVPLSIFIEDTDAYGVVYNGNYLKFYDRALFEAVVDEGADDWSIIRVDKHRFKSSPKLGDGVIIEGTRVAAAAGQYENDDIATIDQIWDVEMKDPGDGTVHNTARLSLGRCCCHCSDETTTTAPPPFDQKGGASGGGGVVSITYQFTPRRDEFDPQLPGRMPLRNVLNLFERSRSNFLGGPDALRKLQQEDRIVFVVTSVDQGSLVYEGTAECVPGKTVSVDTSFVTKRRGMIVECQHTLLCSETKERLAQAVVTIMALNEKSRRPTSDLPQWLVDKMSSS